LFVIHPDPAQISPRALEAFVVRLNSRMAAATLTSDLQAFEAHPDSEFCIGGVYTRRSPYPSFQVLSRTLLKTASDSLLGSRYYAHFSPPVRLGSIFQGAIEMNSSGCKSANDGLLLQTFGTLPRRNLKAVADQDDCFAHVAGEGPHLQRQTGVTEADRTVRSEQEAELILSGLHSARQV